MTAADRRGQQSAAYFNLLGILYEAQHRWRLARKCYCRALDAEEHYEAAKSNLWRVEELRRNGRSERRVVLGDEPEDVWFAQLPTRMPDARDCDHRTKHRRIYDRCPFCFFHAGVFRRQHPLHLRLREAVMGSEIVVVGIVTFLLIIYLFWTLIRPEHF